LKPVDELPDATYQYSVPCCTDMMRKTVTVP
jgi:hypothetical protein